MRFSLFVLLLFSIALATFARRELPNRLIFLVDDVGYGETGMQGVVASIPLRAFIPKRSNNFLVAGRCLSSDRMANSALRVQASCMGMGQAAGATAVLAHRSGVSPSEVPLEDIKNLIREHGGIIPK